MSWNYCQCQEENAAQQHALDACYLPLVLYTYILYCTYILYYPMLFLGTSYPFVIFPSHTFLLLFLIFLQEQL